MVSSFNHVFQNTGMATSMLLLLHSALMLSVAKMLLKGEVGGRALKRHGSYIVDHKRIMENSWKCVSFYFCCNLDSTTESLHSLQTQVAGSESMYCNRGPSPNPVLS